MKERSVHWQSKRSPSLPDDFLITTQFVGGIADLMYELRRGVSRNAPTDGIDTRESSLYSATPNFLTTV
ncbi:MAG: hypothetical protein HC879_16700 [Leptolyngbyaceae cyanobacterium SL_5_9]|nr:hypothetical protein [Leptolyngbyaceae cyanobacterium SL_5_9]NJO73663.1 hypothetical protein [Leptolyngbyaceae cyanobacterium RM1_406_9]